MTIILSHWDLVTSPDIKMGMMAVWWLYHPVTYTSCTFLVIKCISPPAIPELAPLSTSTSYRLWARFHTSNSMTFTNKYNEWNYICFLVAEWTRLRPDSPWSSSCKKDFYSSVKGHLRLVFVFHYIFYILFWIYNILFTWVNVLLKLILRAGLAGQSNLSFANNGLNQTLLQVFFRLIAYPIKFGLQLIESSIQDSKNMVLLLLYLEIIFQVIFIIKVKI